MQRTGLKIQAGDLFFLIVIIVSFSQWETFHFLSGKRKVQKDKRKKVGKSGKVPFCGEKVVGKQQETPLSFCLPLPLIVFSEGRGKNIRG